jgi:hypothetical protein
MSDRSALAAIAESQLTAANRDLKAAGISEGLVHSAEWKPWQTMVVGLSGTFAALDGRELELVIEIDPGVVGWRLSATLSDYGISPSQELTLIHDEGIRVLNADAPDEVRRLTRNGVAALRKVFGLDFDDQEPPDFLKPSRTQGWRLPSKN